MATSTPDIPPPSTEGNQFTLERYKYILQQIHTVNENVYRFLAIYQTLAVALISGGLTLFVGYRKWGLQASVARSGVIGALILTTTVAAFTVLDHRRCNELAGLSSRRMRVD